MSSGSLVNATDHPRSCGANQAANMPVREGGGSSPLVRGQHPTCRHSEHQHRIIPARAGPTVCGAVSGVIVADHPRSCGANGTRHHSEASVDGSSPLVRGQQGKTAKASDGARIIPARAGPTGYQANPWMLGADYPRSCGANSLHVVMSVLLNGSSPLVRGQLYGEHTGRVTMRIIPARAGPTHP